MKTDVRNLIHLCLLLSATLVTTPRGGLFQAGPLLGILFCQYFGSNSHYAGLALIVGTGSANQLISWFSISLAKLLPFSCYSLAKPEVQKLDPVMVSVWTNSHIWGSSPSWHQPIRDTGVHLDSSLSVVDLPCQMVWPLCLTFQPCFLDWFQENTHLMLFHQIICLLLT